MTGELVVRLITAEDINVREGMIMEQEAKIRRLEIERNDLRDKLKRARRVIHEKREEEKSRADGLLGIQMMLDDAAGDWLVGDDRRPVAGVRRIIEAWKTEKANAKAASALFRDAKDVRATARRIQKTEMLADIARKERNEAQLERNDLREQLRLADQIIAKIHPERNALRAEVARLRPVYVAAVEWIDHLEGKGGHYLDGIPGELMDACERAGAWEERLDRLTDLAAQEMGRMVPSDCPASYAPPCEPGCDRACPVGGELESTKEDRDDGGEGMTRDPKRIDRITDLLRERWEQSSDLRLCQLLAIVAGNAGWHEADLFHIEDTEIESVLRKGLVERVTKTTPMREPLSTYDYAMMSSAKIKEGK